MMSMQSNNSLLFFKSLSIPVGALQHQERKETVPARTLTQTYQLAAIAKINKHPIKRKLSILFADTLSVLNILVAAPAPSRTRPQHNPKTFPVGRVDRGLQPRTGCAPGASLEDLGAAEEDGTIVLTVDVQVIFALEELDGLFEKGGGFA